MNPKLFSTYVIDCVILFLLVLFAFGYQTVRNQERVDAQFELAASLFGAKDKSAGAEKSISSVKDFFTVFKGIIDAYYHIPAAATGTFMHYTYGVGNFTPLVPVVEITFHDRPQNSLAKVPLVFSFDVQASDVLGPFISPQSYYYQNGFCGDGVTSRLRYILCQTSSTLDVFDNVDKVKLSFQLYSMRRSDDGRVRPAEWDIEVMFGMGGYGPVITMTTSFSSIEERFPQRFPVMISCAVAPLVLLSFLFRMDRISQLVTYVKVVLTTCRRSQWYGRLRPDNSGLRGQSFLLLGVFSDIVALTFSITSLVIQFTPKVSGTTEHALTVLLGFAAFMRSTQLISVLKLSPSLCVVVDGFVTASDQLFMYVVAVFPILLGYSVCGFIVYGSYQSYFKTVPYSIVTLICAAFGDNLIDTFVDMDRGAYVVQVLFTRIFFGSFLAFFICNVLNVAYSIIQDSYNQAIRMHGATSSGTTGANGSGTRLTEELREILGKLRG
ncbi:Polycystin cation channel, putative [Trypanosoma equiperdum]|uniref:Polycystin cation channel PKD1/PKD2 domain-containing protein n=2 Tax=Trypanozoon TaxID=39700 RepID=Q57VU1_TRYB2|nr:hypothetical protein, conserved [Trypanosoma brucei brucei TREU927]AAX70278.1 hypothetical protein, conserved [Trypanosoma brucei]AAZ12160.1 hypothetical protein, conserved [Trypanosoma brucei brucei TREU927]SCU69353.1 Polycystin cation channel, putative [Trypanosoma equiperdum]